MHYIKDDDKVFVTQVVALTDSYISNMHKFFIPSVCL